MLSQVGWKNAALLCPSKWRSTYKFQVCHIKQFCALKATSFQDFESLSVSDGKIENLDEASESELAFFSDEQLRTSEESSQPKLKKTSIKHSLAYTNKVLYGPLLETSAERKRTNKIEDDETEIKPKTRKKKNAKTKTQKAVLTVEPLISKPENAHLMGLFPVDEPKSIEQFHHQRVKIKHLHKSASFSNPTDGRPIMKKMVFKKSPKDSVNASGNIVFNDTPRLQKIYVSSWHQENELSISSSSNDNTTDEFRPLSENSEDLCENNQENELSIPSTSDDNTTDESKPISEDLRENNTCENISPESTPLACSSSDVKTENDQEIEDLESFRKKSSLLSVDNAKFTSVPNIIDTEMIKSFPLEKTDSSGISSKIVTDTDGNIVTVGMFDGGYQKIPSVSKILEATMPEDQRRILDRWKAKMIKELGEDGFEQYRQGLFDRGKLLHGCIQSELTGITPSLENMPTVQGFWTSMSHILPKISNVSVLESRLVHPYLYYQGAVDCVATYKGMPVLIDWKTSTKPKLTLKSMFDNPLQVVAYLGALNYDHSYQLPHQVESAMLVVAYDNGLPAHVHVIDKEKCEAYWKVWCDRLVQFWRQLEVKESV